MRHVATRLPGDFSSFKPGDVLSISERDLRRSFARVTMQDVINHLMRLAGKADLLLVVEHSAHDHLYKFRFMRR